MKKRPRYGWRERRWIFRQEIGRRFPSLSERTRNTIWRGVVDEYEMMRWLLAASDADLMTLKNFGVKALAEFRAVWPVPVADVVASDPWRDHAEMVAGVR